MPTVHDLIKALDRQYSLARAESWDRVGLQIGDSNAPVQSVLVAHEVTEAVLNEASAYDALVVYHPLIFRPLESLNYKNHTARLAGQCLAHGLHLIAVHTALDNAPPPHALGDKLAESLVLRKVAVLGPAGRESLFKIVVFTPLEALEKVSTAMWEAGAGQIGDYDRASFRARGTGTFRPLPGADPYSGRVGELEEADELRLEVVVPAAQCDIVVRAMIEAHPYEEVAYDVYALHNSINPYGSARVGVLPEPVTFDEWAPIVGEKLRAPNVRVVQGREAVLKVACAPGSGSSVIETAALAGCDCLVTGDIKHHDALKAQALGLSVIDATHTATERAAVGLMADALQIVPDLKIARCEIDTNPLRAMRAV